MESICRAPAGAWAKMEAINEAFPNASDEDYEKREAAFSLSPGTSECYDFSLYGFGKLNSEQWAYLRTVVADEEDLWGGSSENPTVISGLLDLCDRTEACTAYSMRNQITKICWG
jgi:hypothetical protein